MSVDPIHHFPKLRDFIASRPESEQPVLRAVLSGAAPAERVATILSGHGCSVSASTVRTYRRALRAWKEGRDQ